MIKEATNSFSEGIISDVNPINVPNTALTDCVNGTILTYNGNEYSLQNDMGNFGLKNCKLSEGYVPIGMKEYGGILYIVSFNPVENKTEIGSYPSTLVTVKDEKGNAFSETINLINWKSEGKYSDLYKKYDLQIFGIEDKDNSKINPGDKILLEETITEVDDTVEKYQSIDFYIIDENNNLTKISDLLEKKPVSEIKEGEILSLSDVRWKIPGWLAVRLNFIKFNNFLINFTLKELPIFTDENDKNLKFDVSCRVYMSDGYEIGEDVKASVVIDRPKKAGEKTAEETDGARKTLWSGELVIDPSSKVTLPNGTYYYRTVKQEIEVPVSQNDKITISAVPYIENVEYDSLATSYEYVAKSVIFNTERVSLGTNTFNYKVKENGIEVTFDSYGFDTVVSPELYYSLERIDGVNWIKVNEGKLIQVDDFQPSYGITNTFTIPTIVYNESFNPKTDIVAEDVYRISFTAKINGEKIPLSDKKIIYATKLINGFTEDNYDNVNLEEVINKYSDYVGDITLESADITVSDDVELDNTAWLSDLVNKPLIDGYPGFVDSSKDMQTHIASAKQYFDIKNGKLVSDFKLLAGPLWNNLNDNIVVLTKVFDTTVSFVVDKYTGVLSSSDRLNGKGYVQMSKTYKEVENAKGYMMYNYTTDTRLEKVLTEDEFVSFTDSETFEDTYGTTLTVEGRTYKVCPYTNGGWSTYKAYMCDGVINDNNIIWSAIQIGVPKNGDNAPKLSTLELGKSLAYNFPYKICITQFGPYGRTNLYTKKVGADDTNQLYVDMSLVTGNDDNTTGGIEDIFQTLLTIKQNDENLVFLPFGSDQTFNNKITVVNSISENIGQFHKMTTNTLCNFINITKQELEQDFNLSVNTTIDGQTSFSSGYRNLTKLSDSTINIVKEVKSNDVITGISFNNKEMTSQLILFDADVDSSNTKFNNAFTKRMDNAKFFEGKFLSKKDYYYFIEQPNKYVSTWQAILDVLNEEYTKFNYQVDNLHKFYRASMKAHNTAIERGLLINIGNYLGGEHRFTATDFTE